jgi:predicted HTH transcriptional regulator
MATLEDKQADSINPTDIDALVGREENQKLEYKETIDKINAHELAKDLASFANAEGGYIVVGAVQSKATEKCIGFRSVSSVDGTLKKIRHVGATHIEERLALEPIVREASSGERLVLVQIPRSPKL